MAQLSLVPPPSELRSPLPATAAVAFAIFALGTTLYALGVPAWSGRHLFAFDVGQGALAPLHDRQPRGPWSRGHEIGPVRLDPEMSPARVLAHVVYRPDPGVTPACRVTMRRADGRVVWSETREFGAYAVGQSSRHSMGTLVPIETFDVPREDEYTFVVDFGDAGDAIRSAHLEVRRQVASVQLWFVILGAMLAMASLFTALVTGPRAERFARRRDEHAA